MSWPNIMPMKMKLMMNCVWLAKVAFRSVPMVPNAGIIASMEMATTDIKDAIRIINSVMVFLLDMGREIGRKDVRRQLFLLT